MRKLSLTLLAAAALLGGLSTHAQAQALLAFSGGNGAPLVATLSLPVTFTLTQNYSGTSYLVIKGLGNAYLYSIYGVSVAGTSQFQETTGSQAIYSLQQHYGGNTVINGGTDAYFQGNSFNLLSGQTVTWTAGTLTTPDNYAGAPPASGSYRAYFFSNNGSTVISTYGVSVAPEPGTWALLGVGTLGLGVTVPRRRPRMS